jgi:hypothetical protein
MNLADLQRSNDAATDAAHASHNAQRDDDEALSQAAQELAWQALDSRDPTGNLHRLGFDAGTVLPEAAGQVSGCIDDVVIHLIRDMRAMQHPREAGAHAYRVLMALADRIVEQTAETSTCLEEARGEEWAEYDYGDDDEWEAA